MSSRSSLPFLCFALALSLAALPAAAQVNFEAQLFGQNEVPAVNTEAYGSCLGILAEDETTFTVSCEHTLADEDLTGSHIHLGFAGENGPVIFDLGDPSSPIQATWNLDADEVVRLLSAGLYVNVHTEDHLAGEIRGQLRPTPPNENRRLQFRLLGNQVEPAVATDADGACVADVEFERVPFLPVQEATVTLRCTHDVDDPVSATLFLAEAGEEGDVLLELDSPFSPIEQTFVLGSQSQVNAFLNGNIYLEIDSISHPDGELRGQLAGCLAGANVLCLNDNRFQVEVNWTTESDAGDGVAVPETDDSGLFWFFRPSNLELLVKVLDGCGVNDRYWVFLAGTTNVGFNLRVTDTLSGEQETYSNTRGQTADTVLDTDAFATCP